MFSHALARTQQKLCRIFGIRFFSVEEVNELAEQVAEQVRTSDFHPDLVFGILNGGYYPARQIARTLNVPNALIDFSWPKVPRLNDYCSVLLVDDYCRTGKAFETAESLIAEAANDHLIEVRRAALISRGDCRPEFLTSKVSSSARFPWTSYSPYFEDYRREILSCKLSRSVA